MNSVLPHCMSRVEATGRLNKDVQPEVKLSQVLRFCGSVVLWFTVENGWQSCSTHSGCLFAKRTHNFTTHRRTVTHTGRVARAAVISLLIRASCLFYIDIIPLAQSRRTSLCSTDSLVLRCSSHLIQSGRHRCDVIQLGEAVETLLAPVDLGAFVALR